MVVTNHLLTGMILQAKTASSAVDSFELPPSSSPTPGVASEQRQAATKPLADMNHEILIGLWRDPYVGLL